MKSIYLRVTVASCAVFLTSIAAFAASPTLEKIKASSAITLGYRESSIPFSYLGTDQKPVGISIDLCSVIVEKIKSDLDLPKLDVNWVAVNASNRIPLIQNGTVDIECGSTTNTAERQKQVSFSVATFASQQQWLTRTGTGIDNVGDLKGKTVVITQGSLAQPVSEKINKVQNLDLKPIFAKDQAESLLMLRTGRALAWFEDDILQAGLVAASPDPTAFKVLKGSGGDVNYFGLMMAKGDDEFKKLVDGTLSGEMASGHFADLYAQWFTQPIQPNNQDLKLEMSDALKERVAKPSDALSR